MIKVVQLVGSLRNKYNKLTTACPILPARTGSEGSFGRECFAD
jgi:hypothetical protein